MTVQLRFIAPALAAVVLSLGCSTSGPAVVSATGAGLDGITVNGAGEVIAAPDVARVNVGVEVRADAAERAMNEASAKMTAVTTALRKAGVAEKDMRTNQVALHRELEPVTEPAAMPMPSKPAGPMPTPPSMMPRTREVYRAASTLELTVRDLARVGALLQAATQAGANQLHDIRMTVEDPKPLERQAREKAMADARARADQLAKLAGVELGPVLSIQDGDGHVMPPPMPMMASARADMASDMPIQRGELRMTRQVTVRYAIRK